MYDELILRLRKDAEFLKISSRYNNTANEFAERISQAADVIEKLSKDRKKGKWIKPTRVPDSMLSECTVCGFDTGAYTFNFCPHCGAEMSPTYMSGTKEET